MPDLSPTDRRSEARPKTDVHIGSDGLARVLGRLAAVELLAHDSGSGDRPVLTLEIRYPVKEEQGGNTLISYSRHEALLWKSTGCSSVLDSSSALFRLRQGSCLESESVFR